MFYQLFTIQTQDFPVICQINTLVWNKYWIFSHKYVISLTNTKCITENEISFIQVTAAGMHKHEAVQPHSETTQNSILFDIYEHVI